MRDHQGGPKKISTRMIDFVNRFPEWLLAAPFPGHILQKATNLCLFIYCYKCKKTSWQMKTWCWKPNNASTVLPLGEWNIVISVSVCLPVCVSASLSPKLYVLSPPNFCACYLWLWGGVTISFVLPVLWMTCDVLYIKGRVLARLEAFRYY